MDQGALTSEEARAMFLHVAARIDEGADQLTRADRAAGDGDHGVGMARGFTAVRHELNSRSFDTAGELLRTIGQTLLTSVGGASGVVFGTFFREGAIQLVGRATFDADGLRLLLVDGLRAVQDRGKASPGDKTMVDALAPAVEKALELSSAPLDQLLSSVRDVAREGVEKTKTMVARVGKAKTLGERSLGHPDPGALSLYLILDAMAEYVAADRDAAM